MFTTGEWNNVMSYLLMQYTGMNILAVLKDGTTRQLTYDGIQWFTGPDVNNAVIVDPYSIRWWKELPD